MWAHGNMRASVAAGLVVVSLLALLVVKARFLTVYVLFLTVVCACIEPRFTLRKALVVVAVLATASYALGVALALGGVEVLQRLNEQMLNYAMLGGKIGADTFGTLDGRLPLWGLLVEYINERPLLGYGFGAFWNPNQMQLVWSRLTWQPPVGHSGYLDETLGTGLVGIVLLLSAWLAALLAALRLRVLRVDRLSGLVVLWMVLFLLLNAGDTLMQTYFQAPFIIGLTSVLALLASQVPASLTSARQQGRVRLEHSQFK